MSETGNNSNNGPGAGTGCPVQQRGLDRHHTTARKKWSKEVNILVLECHYRSNPIDENGVPLKGYRQRMHMEWLERGPFGDVTEQRIYD